MNGFDVDPADLMAAARGIEAIIGELSSMGIDVLAAGQQGRGFDQLKMTGMELGSTNLRDTLDEYCDRWQWGVRSLVQDAQAISYALNLTAGLNLAVDQHVMDSLKVLGASTFADPRASEEDVISSSWTELSTDTATADYSGDSFQQSYEDSKETWSAVVADQDGPPGAAGVVADIADTVEGD